MSAPSPLGIPGAARARAPRESIHLALMPPARPGLNTVSCEEANHDNPCSSQPYVNSGDIAATTHPVDRHCIQALRCGTTK